MSRKYEQRRMDRIYRINGMGSDVAANERAPN